MNNLTSRGLGLSSQERDTALQAERIPPLSMRGGHSGVRARFGHPSTRGDLELAMVASLDVRGFLDFSNESLQAALPATTDEIGAVVRSNRTTTNPARKDLRR
jgi:hypothetical protein